MKRLLLVPLLLVLIAGLASGSAGAQGGGEGALTILMAYPGEGESFYVAPTGFLLSMPVAGRVVDYDTHLDPATVEVTLSVINQDGVLAELVAPLDDAGFFEVWAAVQPHDRPFPSDDPHDLEDCAICHHWSRDLQIPGQVTQLMVHAIAEDGRTGHTVRRFRVDRGSIRELSVIVDGLPEDAAGGQVSARTIIYNWRRRAAHGPISGGQAALQVERLTYADLTYTVAMDPLIVDGTRYSAESTTVIVPGGSEAPIGVTLHARPERASLTGQVLTGQGTGAAASVLAVDLFSGAAQTVMAGDDGAFTFADLPVAKYVLLARAPGGYHLPAYFDLTDALNAGADIHLIPGGSALLSGTVSLEGQPAPFAEISVGGLPIAYGDPVTGAFAVDAVPAEGELEVEITAAGCYGVRRSVLGRDLGAIALTLRPDTRMIERGGARLYLPAESSATDSAGIVTLTQGVLWVRPTGRAGGVPLQVRAGSALLEGGDGAAFAVEKLTGARGRLYVSQGSVRVTAPDGDALEVMAGQTLVLEGVSGQPVPLAAGVGPLLRSVAGSVARYVEAPTTTEKIADAAYQGLVLAARVTLVLAYGIALVFPVIVIGGLVLYIVRRRRTPAAR